MKQHRKTARIHRKASRILVAMCLVLGMMILAMLMGAGMSEGSPPDPSSPSGDPSAEPTEEISPPPAEEPTGTEAPTDPPATAVPTEEPTPTEEPSPSPSPSLHPVIINSPTPAITPARTRRPAASKPTSVPTAPKPVEGKVEDDRELEEDGWLTAVLGADEIAQAIDLATALAHKQSKQTGIAAAFDFRAEWTAGAAITLTAGALQGLEVAGVQEFTLYMPAFRCGFDLAAVASLLEQTGEVDVTVVVTPAEDLSPEALAIAGGRPVYELHVYYEVNGEGYEIVDLGDGLMTWGIAYQKQTGENDAGIKAVFVEGDGSVWTIQESMYADGWVNWMDSCCSAVCGVGGAR